VTVRYFFPKASLNITVVQSLTCNKAGVIAVTTATPVVSYTADRSQAQTIAIADLGRSYANASATFTLSEDGRLKAVGTESTGQGEAILKSALGLAGAVGLVRAPVAAAAAAAVLNKQTPCEVIKDWGREGAVTLTYRLPNGNPVDLTAAAGGTRVDLEPTPDSETLYAELLSASFKGLNFQLRVGKHELVELPAQHASSTLPAKPQNSSGLVWITLNRTASVALEVRNPDDGKVIWTSQVVVPSTQPYHLPIPRAQLFGKQTFALELSDAGSVTKISYGTEAGAAGALNAAAALAGATRPSSVAEQAAELQAQANLIAQQERLARCRANRAACI
jgi:hypothetical protein